MVLKTRTKIEAAAAMCFLCILAGMSLQATYLSYTSSNGTYAWSSTDTTFITCSNGQRFNATAAGLQKAINSLNNISGLIQLPVCYITITTPIKLGTGCHLQGVGNASILQLGNGANTTVIKNYDQTNGNHHITINDLKIEGNCLNQDVYYSLAADPFYTYTCGVWLKKCKYIEIYSVTVNSTRNQGILADKCQYVDVHDCFFTNIAISYDGSGKAHYAAEGVYYYNTSDSVITNCFIDNAYSIGIVVEGYIGAPERYWSQNVTVSNCVVTNTGVGYYVEDCKYTKFDTCTISCGTDDSCYSVLGARGFLLSNNINHITIMNCIIRDTYRGISQFSPTGSYHSFLGNEINDTTSYGIEFFGSNSLINHNTIGYTGNYAIYVAKNNNSICDNNIHHVTSDGIKITGHNNSINRNIIFKAGQWSTGIIITGSKNNTVMFNNIIGTGTVFPNIGITGGNTDSGCVVLFNHIVGVQFPIYQVKGRVNCTGYKDWNFYKGVI